MDKIRATDDKQQLEGLGQIISAEEMRDALNAFIKEPGQKWKILPLMIKMPPQVFAKLLAYANDAQLELLKTESMTEPLQHQLLLFSHLWENKFQELLEKEKGLQKISGNWN